MRVKGQFCLPLFYLILISFVFESFITTAQAENNIFTAYSSFCKEECKKAFGDERHSCKTVDNLDPWGWDYCSPQPGTDYRGKECRSNHCCGHHGKNYNWCYTTDGSWGYCSPPITYEGVTHKDWKGRRCTSPCDIYSAKTSDYFWCHASGQGWSTCSPHPNTTIKGKACKPNHGCGYHSGKPYSWCYLDDNGNWDYCGVYENVTEWHDLDHWQYTEGRLQPVRQLMYGSTINSIPNPVCQGGQVNNNSTSTIISQDDEGLITLLEIAPGSNTLQSFDNEEQRRNAYICIADLRRRYGNEPGRLALPLNTNSNPIASVGSGANGVNLNIQGLMTAADGKEYYNLQLVLNSQPRTDFEDSAYDGVVGTCIIPRQLAYESPRFISLALLNSLKYSQDIIVRQRRVQRRYWKPLFT